MNVKSFQNNPPNGPRPVSLPRITTKSSSRSSTVFVWFRKIMIQEDSSLHCCAKSRTFLPLSRLPEKTRKTQWRLLMRIITSCIPEECKFFSRGRTGSRLFQISSPLAYHLTDAPGSAKLNLVYAGLNRDSSS